MYYGACQLLDMKAGKQAVILCDSINLCIKNKMLVFGH